MESDPFPSLIQISFILLNCEELFHHTGLS